jgi:SAM-dependent methyltransferase
VVLTTANRAAKLPLRNLWGDKHLVRESITDADKNVAFNRQRWGDREAWVVRDKYGYQWGQGIQQVNGGMARLADSRLRQFLPQETMYSLKILELSPGAGRFTAELIRYARAIDLLDMNQACLDLCAERFKANPCPMRFYLNDGRSCAMVEDSDYDLIASFDSMVHMHPDVIRGYVNQLAEKAAPGGILWFDHSGKGIREAGHRTDMTPERMAEFAAEAGLTVVSQQLRNDHDCISVLRKPTG